MSLTITPREDVLIEGAVYLGIVVGAKDAADKYNRAQTWLKISAICSAIAAGSQSALTAANQAVLAITDPGLAQLASDAMGQVQPIIQAAAAGNPLVSAGVQLVAGNLAQSITAIASKYPAPNPAAHAA